MELRKSICEAIEMLMQNFKYILDKKEKKLLVAAWHLGLDDIADDRIVFATQLAIKNLKWFPVPSEIRTFAKQLAREPDRGDSAPLCNHDLNNVNIKGIIEKLKLPEKIKADKFKDFKKNRKVIEFNRRKQIGSR